MPDDGIKITTQVCALTLGCEQSACAVCLPGGCRMCPYVTETGDQKSCTLPHSVCAGKPCPRFKMGDYC